MTITSHVTQALAAVAMGRAPADLVIRDGQWVCVQTGEIIPHSDIAIKGERIAYIGPNAGHAVGSDTVVIEARGKYLVPGLLDAHMHIESSMLTVTEVVRAVAPRGTTGLFVDPHEIANVFGLAGVELMVDEAGRQPIHVWVQAPSCVPSAPGLETPGATLGPAEVAEALSWPGVIGLGEVMNFPGVIQGDEKMHAEMAAACQAGKVIGGHYAAPDLGRAFHAYAAGGAEDDHEGTTLEDAVARARQGMKVMMRYGSGWKDVAAQVRAVTELGLDPRHFLLCNDDIHAETLAQQGHMDRVVRHTIAQGVAPITAIQMATLNTAEHFGVARRQGQIAPGRCADIVLVDDLHHFQAGQVIAKGRSVAENGQMTIDLPAYAYPTWATHSVHLKCPLAAEMFRIDAGTRPPGATARVNVIGVVESQAPTRRLIVDLPVVSVDANSSEVRLPAGGAATPFGGLAKAAVIDRHHASGRVTVGLVSGFGFDAPCAVASTVAHDSHHLLVVGTSETDMALAANQLAAVGGGQVVVKQGEIIGRVELPIAGLMSNEIAEIVARKAAGVLAGMRACGCRLHNANMQLSLLALVVIPELRLSDLGLVDVTRFGFIPVLDQV